MCNLCHVLNVLSPCCQQTKVVGPPPCHRELSGNTYRPHLVIGDPNQRQAIIADGNRLTEEYIGIAFDDGPAVPEVDVEMVAVLTLMYFPHPMYDRLKPAVTFTVREGPK